MVAICSWWNSSELSCMDKPDHRPSSAKVAIWGLLVNNASDKIKVTTSSKPPGSYTVAVWV